MKNSETLKDAVIDFEGTNHLKQRKPGELHRLFIGGEKLEVNTSGQPTNYSQEIHHLFQLLGKFTAGGSQVLLGACNANKCISVAAQMSVDMNAVIYGHNSYSYSMSLNTGRFYGGTLNQYPSVADGNQSNLGHYFRIDPD